MDTTLVIMAAGIGSRFGGGIKQLEPVGPSGEIIMDYSIYDACRAGFNKVICIIRKDIEEDFRRIIGNRIERIVDTSYAFQEIRSLPVRRDDFADRKKPWGTGQAVLSIAPLLRTPFVVINADDYYGREGFALLHRYITDTMSAGDGILDCAMAGFMLKNTLSDNGGVTRGVCRTDPEGYLKAVTETFEIERVQEAMEGTDAKGSRVNLSEDTVVSMNMWALPAEFIAVLQDGFPEFLEGLEKGDQKSEYLLPSVIDSCIQSGKARVRVLPTEEKWFGVTYKEDKESVVRSIRSLIEKGVYPSCLYPGTDA